MHAKMTCSPEERAQRERCDELYVRAQSPVMLTIERSVCGCNYGASGWTTEREAERLATLLALRSRAWLSGQHELESANGDKTMRVDGGMLRRRCFPVGSSGR